MIDPEQYYQQRLAELQQLLQQQLRKKSQLGWARFGIIAAIAAACYFILPYGIPYTLGAALLLVIIFVRLVVVDIGNKKSILHTELLIEVNQDELAALDGKYSHFSDGSHLAAADHLYANDLDIVGKASLFQYLNRTTSAMGESRLSNWLLYPSTESVIIERQVATKELTEQTAWRQALQAFGKEKKIAATTYQRLQEWMNEDNQFLDNTAWLLLQFAIPAVMIAVVTLNWFDVLSNPVRNYFLLASAVLAFFISKKALLLHAKVSKVSAELEVLSDSIDLIENATFKATLLLQLQATYQQDNSKASAEIKKLQGIVQRMDWRLNPVVFIPLAILLQWDLQQVMALERWKKRNHKNISQWFDALGNIEALNSFATLQFNHPNWCVPQLKEPHFFISGTAVGHPLINPKKRINNPIDIENKGIIMLITGSNMAGKSTYLRSIGINVVLTMAGAVACAKNFSLSPVQLITSMRIADNLEENTSTFYAELKKLKTVIEKANQQEKVLILLDEILRGTNSLDRHTGAVALTRQLIRQNAAGIIATHDVELAGLAENYPSNIQNFHFDAQVSNDELYFDYKLKEGICTSINASILMKKIGIEI